MNFSIMSSVSGNGKTSGNPLYTADIRAKIAQLESACHRILKGESFTVPGEPARDLEVVPIKALPGKKGLSSREGQARLMHDLASIELQAMELAFRSLCEFPDAPPAFREQLAQIAYEESQHLTDCLNALDEVGFRWGTWPVHLGLWHATAAEDSLLDRILIVHRYLEGSGLDAGETLLQRLKGMGEGPIPKVVGRIHREEVDHVRFGSRWYRELCRREGLDPDKDFPVRLTRLFGRIPRRLEPIRVDIRKQAEFSESEIECLQGLRNRWLNASGGPRIHG